MSRSLFVDVAMKVTGASELGTATGQLERVGGLSKTTTIALAGVSAGFVALGKGALEAEKAEGRFVAATGRSAEEADEFVDSLNDIAGSAGTIGVPFEKIADAGIEVARQFDLVGEEGAALTEKFLEFSKVTGTNAVDAVNAVDGALDAFGLPASEATALMDKLTYSSQTFGTDVGPAAVDTLTRFAPALQAMGSSLDDGITLLNLFEEAGVDAAGAQKGFTSAVENIPPGENLKTVLERIQAIENPAERTAAAVEIFGNKAGQGIAQALGPGREALDTYSVTAEDAAGRTSEAAEAMLTTSDRLRGFADKAIAGLRDLGDQFGPLAAGAGAVIPLFATMATNVAATGTAAATAAGGWGALLLAIAPFAAVALAVAGGVIAIDQALLIANSEMLKFRDAVNEMSSAEKEAAADTEILGLRVGDILETSADVAGMVVPWHNVADATRQASDALNETGTASLGAEKDMQTLSRGAEVSSGAIGVFGRAVGLLDDEIREGAPAVRTASMTLADALPQALLESQREAARIAAMTPGEIAAGLRGGRDSWKGALDLLKSDMQSSMDRTKEIAKLEAVLAGKNIRDGLASADPIVRAQAAETSRLITDRLNELKGAAYDAGSGAANGLENGLATFKTVAIKPYRFTGMQSNTSVDYTPRVLGGNRMAGGPVMPWRDYTVGEGGPEIVRIGPNGGTVIPHNRDGAGKQFTVNVYTGVGDPVEIGREVSEALRAYERASGAPRASGA